jgi:cephalosporin hydroxylase
MTLNYTKNVLEMVTKTESTMYGLNWIPTTEPHVSDKADWAVAPPMMGKPHFSEVNHLALITAFNKLKTPPKFIVEIGVDRSEQYDVSSTSTLLKLKSDDCIYVGIDIEDKSYLNNPTKNIFTLKTDSANHEVLYDFMIAHNIPSIDFMFVDGWHSTAQVLEEWKYWEWMSTHAIMAFHDTNFHTGPIVVLDAVDTTLFNVEYFGRDLYDWGVGVVERL